MAEEFSDPQSSNSSPYLEDRLMQSLMGSRGLQDPPISPTHPTPVPGNSKSSLSHNSYLTNTEDPTTILRPLPDSMRPASAHSTSSGGGGSVTTNDSTHVPDIAKSPGLRRTGRGADYAGTIPNTDVSDLINIPDLDDQEALDVLEWRFEHGEPFTDMGCRDLIYLGPTPHCDQPSTSKTHTSHPDDWLNSNPNLERTMGWVRHRATEMNRDQCVVLFGPEGSGKSRLVHDHLRTLSRSSSGGKRALSAFLILRAFSSTYRPSSNDASLSSHLFDLSLDFKGDIIGTNIQNVLLCKNEIMGKMSDEGSDDSVPVASNYQIIYHLLHGASIQQLKGLKLHRNPQSYALLRHSPPPTSVGSNRSLSNMDSPINSEKGKIAFSELKEALERVGLSMEEQNWIWTVLAAILKLGNLDFQAMVNLDGTPQCCLIQETELQEVCQLIGCDFETFRLILTSKVCPPSLSGSQTNLIRTLGMVHSGTSQQASRVSSHRATNSNDRGSSPTRKTSDHKTQSNTTVHRNSTGPSDPTTRSRKESVCRCDLPLAEAREQRNQLCWTLYSRLFHWLIGKINQELKPDPKVARSTRIHHVGFIDIPGWAVSQSNFSDSSHENTGSSVDSMTRSVKRGDFTSPGEKAENRLDKFLENVLKEKLHTVFTLGRLKDQQQSYTVEGLSWQQVPVDLTTELASEHLESCLNLLENDKNQEFHENLHRSMLQTHPVFTINEGEKFTIQHFWGPVTYDSSQFPRLNSETLNPELSSLIFNGTKIGLLKQLLPEGDPKNKRSVSKRRLCAGAQFKISLNSVLSVLSHRESSFIFCIKPANAGWLIRYTGSYGELIAFILIQWKKKRLRLKMPNAESVMGSFSRSLVMRQIQKLRIVELADLTGRGYVRQESYRECLTRYRMLSQATWPRWDYPARQGVIEILKSQPIPNSAYAFGRSRLFWKSTKAIWSLEAAREKELHRLAKLIQWAFRLWYYTHGLRTFARAQTTIASHYRRYRARKRYLKLRWSTAIIAAHFRGWKTRKQLRRFHQNVSADKILQFLRNSMRRSYLWRLARSLPSESPICIHWPDFAPILCKSADAHLCILYHRWRCRKYRAQVDQQGYFRMREKLAASLIFKDKKASYPHTVSHPFRGDYVRLRQNPKWRRISLDTSDEYVVFADLVSKINRSSGKVNSVLLVLSTAGILLLDHRTLTVKHRAPVTEVLRVSLSPHADTVAVLHLIRQSGLSKRSGDFLVECRHIIELVSKLYLVIQNVVGKPPPVDITDSIWVESDQEKLEVVFRAMEQAGGSTLISPSRDGMPSMANHTAVATTPENPPTGGPITYDPVTMGSVPHIAVDRLESSHHQSTPRGTTVLSSCFSTSPERHCVKGSSSTQSYRSLSTPGARLAGAGGNTDTPSSTASGPSSEGTPTHRRMKFIRRGGKLEILF